MKSVSLLKHAGLVAVVFTLVAACSSKAPQVEEEEPVAVEEPVVEEPVVAVGISKEAEDAIAWAKAVRYRANGMGCEWNDTGEMIAAAEVEGNAGRNDSAVAMANEAEDIAVKALDVCEQDQDVAKTSSYTVIGGDSLWGIAAMDGIYADPYQWPLIYRSNSDQIKDADLIYPGQVFVIDNAPDSEHIAAAIAHAKSRGAWSVGVVEDSDQEYLKQ